MVEEFLVLFRQSIFPQALHIIALSWPIWLPIIVIYAGWHTWLKYVRRHWLASQGYVLMEIKLPRDVPKSPAAMEFVLQGIWENANMSTPGDAFWEGKMREWFSLEIVSRGGEIKFYIWAFPRWKKIIETRVYAQYPNAEVHEVKDYALDIHYKYNETYVWGVTTALVKPDAYPIKTYIEYELDKKGGSPEEQQEVVDPLTPVLEYLGSLGPHETAVVQILIRAHAAEGLLYARLRKKKDWQDDIKAEIKKIITEESLVTPEKDKPQGLLSLTDTQKQSIAAIQRNGGKLAFDSMVRLFYIAPQDNYEKTRGIGLIGSMRQFASRNLNGIKPEFFSFTYNWQDFNDMRKKKRLTEYTEAVKRRSFFEEPFKNQFGKPYVLSTEEVATLFHFPSLQVSPTPTLSRVPSKKAEAPANLPI